MRNIIILVLSVILITAPLTACGGVAAAKSSYPADTPEPPPANRTIRVSGSGRAVLSPDIAYVNIGVHTESKDAVEAVTSNNIQTQKVTDALVDAGIDEKDTQTTNFSIYPRQDYDSQGKPTGEITMSRFVTSIKSARYLIPPYRLAPTRFTASSSMFPTRPKPYQRRASPLLPTPKPWPKNWRRQPELSWEKSRPSAPLAAAFRRQWLKGAAAALH